MEKTKRIAIIGNAGSGKSVFAKRLSTTLNLPVYHLDQFFWKLNWERPDMIEYKQIHDGLCAKEQWIIEGMNLKVADYRMQRADIIIYLDFPLYKCFWRIFKRTCKYYGKETPSGAVGCTERFNLEFVRFLNWVRNFKKDTEPKIIRLLNEYGQAKKVIILKSQKDIDTFIKAYQEINVRTLPQ